MDKDPLVSLLQIMNRKSITIMTSTGSAMNQYSDAVEGDSYYGITDGLHTIQVVYNAYVGRIRMQATLSTTPESADWFNVLPDSTIGTAWNSAGYVQFDTEAPAAVSEAYTFRGNFTYLRCYMDREYISDGSTYDVGYGQIQKIIFSS